MNRPLIQKSILELEKLFTSFPSDDKSLNLLRNELNHRKVPRARALLDLVEEALLSQSEGHIPKQIPLIETTSIQSKTIKITNSEHQASKSESNEQIIQSKNTIPAELSLIEAYKILGVTSNSSWDLIERKRYEIVEQANPKRLENVGSEMKLKVQHDAKMANLAYSCLLNHSTNISN